jgi:glycosyltransferase involved in cell wall biosynthesis
MTPVPPQLSVVIPSYGRPEPLKYTLGSVARAASTFGAPVELLLVDDGSEPPMAEQLRGYEPGIPVTHLRQKNQGSIVARLTGLAEARGDFVLFLDSDDLVHPDKFARQVGLMQEAAADVSYADMGSARLGADYGLAQWEPAEELPVVDDPAELFIKIQPAPHNPIYRRSYLQRALESPLIPPMRTSDSAGDVWLYYNLSVFPAKIVKAGGPLSSVGPHEEDRYSRHWENLAVAALRIMEGFVRACPKTEATVPARRAVGEAAFQTWRRLPRRFNDGFARRMLAIYRQSPRSQTGNLGTQAFARLARFIGPLSAARILRLFRAQPYSSSRTLSDEEYRRLFAGF